MNTNELKSFITVAQCGSFQKAAELLFLSSTAIIKQINSLENEIGFKLFLRTNKGVLLTDSGKVFYDYSKDNLRRMAEAVQSAKDRSHQGREPVRIGFSAINPYKHITDISIFTDGSDSMVFPILVPISSKFNQFIDEVRNLGRNVDIIPYYLQNKLFDSFCQEFCLARIPMYIAVYHKHPLAEKEVIRFDDLNGQNVVTIASNFNSSYESFNERLRKEAPHVRLTSVSFIDFSLFNEIIAENNLLLVGGYIKDTHPLLRFIPLEEELLLPYGLLYSITPSPGVEIALQSFREAGISGKIEESPIFHYLGASGNWIENQ